MAELTILYGHPDDPAEFERYYTEQHLPLAQRKMPNVKDSELTQVVAAPAGEQLPYYRIAELWWEDVETLQAPWPPMTGRRSSPTWTTSSRGCHAADLQRPVVKPYD